jgi:hypothetical protein
MNYTKVIRKGKYKYTSTDEKIKISSEVLKDIKKTKILIENYMRVGKFVLTN